MAGRQYLQWTTSQERVLREAIDRGLTLRQAAALLGRRVDGVRARARALGLRVDHSLTARIRRQCDIDETDPDACWIWRGHLAKSDGKPRINVGGTARAVLPVAMREAGLWRAGWRFARAICETDLCVRPEHGKGFTGSEYVRHLFRTGRLGSASHNRARAESRRRWAALDLELVRDLRHRHAAGATVDELLPLARGVCRDTLTRALTGRTWREPTVFGWRPAGEGRAAA